MKIEEIRKAYDEELEKDHIDWENMAILMKNLGSRIEELREYVKPVHEMCNLLSDMSLMAEDWWKSGREDEANLLETYYEIQQRSLAGKERQGIRSVKDCLGKTLTEVEKLYLGSGEMPQEGTFREGLVLWFEDTPMVLNEYLDSFVNPYFLEDEIKQIQQVDISAEFSKLIGSRLTDHHYTGTHTLKLHFDNGNILHFSNKQLFRSSLYNVAYYWIAGCEGAVHLEPGITRGKFYLKNGIYPGKDWRIYNEQEVFLQIGEKIYRIYRDSKGHQEGLYIQELPEFACERLSLSVEGKEFTFDSYGYHDGNTSDMFFSCGEEVLCLTCGSRGRVRMILLDKGTFDPKNVREEKGKEIHFVRE